MTPKTHEVITALQAKPAAAGIHMLKVSVPLTGHQQDGENKLLQLVVGILFQTKSWLRYFSYSF